MRHERVEWFHSFPNEPIVIFQEVNDDSILIRKIEIFSDGRITATGFTGEFDSDFQKNFPVPPLDEINENPEFSGFKISEDSFNALWKHALNDQADLGGEGGVVYGLG